MGSGTDGGAGTHGTTATGPGIDAGAVGGVDAAGNGAPDGASGDDSGTAVGGPPWAGILDPARAIDWSGAGVVGGIPTRTTVCATLNPGATAAQINAAITACPSGQVVSLTSGSYPISDDGIVMKSGVTLRGAGADKTLLVFSKTNYCSNLSAAICFSGTNDWSGGSNTQPGAANAADWTGGYAQGATQITLSNVGSTGITVGQTLYLDQANDTAAGADFFVCDETMASCSLEGGNGGRVINGVLRSQIQIVKVTAVSGSTYTITPGLYSPNWRASQSPGAWWPTTPIQNAGLEDLSVDATNSGGQMNVAIYNASDVWVRGVRLVRTCTCERDLVQFNMAAHCTVADSYFYGTQGQSVNYGVEAYGASDNLVENNVFQHVVAPMVIQLSLGSVYAYNYAINDTYADSQGIHWLQGEFIQHNAGVEFQLYEGNVGPGFGGDVFHGNQLMNSLFRNYFLGTDPGRPDDTTAVSLESYIRYMNIVGNVLGTPGRRPRIRRPPGPARTGPSSTSGAGTPRPPSPWPRTRWSSRRCCAGAITTPRARPCASSPAKCRARSPPTAAPSRRRRRSPRRSSSPRSPHSGPPRGRGPPSAPTSPGATSPAWAATPTPSPPRTASSAPWPAPPTAAATSSRSARARATAPRDHEQERELFSRPSRDGRESRSLILAGTALPRAAGVRSHVRIGALLDPRVERVA